jgi:predicted alpha/beta-fold hydrolase
VRGAVAISPVLHPARTLAALEQGPALYRHFLARRWARSLRRKQRIWADVHDFSSVLRTRDLRRMTAALVHHTPFATVDDYLEGYALTAARLASVRVPCGLLLAEDDPLVPIEQLADLTLPTRLCVRRTPYGGHCGFIESPRSLTLAERFVLEQFARFR